MHPSVKTMHIYLRLNITEEFPVCMKDAPAAHTSESPRRTSPAATRDFALRLFLFPGA